MTSPSALEQKLWFASAWEQCTPTERSVMTILALRGSTIFEEWLALAERLQLLGATTYRLMGPTLRALLTPLKAHGLYREPEPGLYECGPGVRAQVLRWAAREPTLNAFTRVCCRDEAQTTVVAIVAQTDATAQFVKFRRSNAAVANGIALDLLEPFDEAWLAGVPVAFRETLLHAGLTALEQTLTGQSTLYAWAVSLAPGFESLTERAMSSLAGAALLRGDRATLEALAKVKHAPALRPHHRIALAMMDGRWPEAAREASDAPAPTRDGHLGVLSLLYWLALRMVPKSTDRLRDLAARGGKAGAPMRQTYRIAESILDGQSGSGTASIKFARGVSGDTLTALWLSVHLGAPPYEGFLTYNLIDDLGICASNSSRAGYHWLQEQCALAAEYLRTHSANLHLYGRRAASPPSVARPRFGPSILEARSDRPAWETALDRLEELAGGTTDKVAEPEPSAAEERILWRTHPNSATIEPYVQKRSKHTWSAGRKLAVKHLISPSPLLQKLPEEDKKVAAFARETRTQTSYYPVVDQVIGRGAWRVLVGHPRVYIGMAEVPIDVLLGEPKIVVGADKEGVVARLQPEGLTAGINVQHDAGRIVVYDIGPRLERLLSELAAPLRVPAAGRERALKSIEGLASLVAIESTESAATSNVRSAPANGKPCIRLAPSGGGLTITLVVRPLGPGGPVTTPGLGAPRLTGKVGGEPLQVLRDLEDELRRSERALAACTQLEGAETGPYTWFLEDPSSCLELVTALNGLGDAIDVEWPHGSPLRVRARLGRSSLRGRIGFSGGFFSVSASASVDGELSLDLEQILELIGKNPGRFIQLATGDYVELEQDLRDVLNGIAAAQRTDRERPDATLLPASAMSVMDELTARFDGLVLDKSASAWRDRLDAVWKKTFHVPKTFQGDLRTYQLEGFRWLARLSELELGACLADDMGLGKTVQLIALLLHRASAGAALVVAPTSVCENWRREIERFGPALVVHPYWGPEREGQLASLGRRKVVVTSYALLQQDDTALQAIEWATVILDEGQLIKNAETLRAKAAFGLRAKARVIATGTPVENHAGDLFSLFHFLSPGLLGSWKSFSAAMADPRGSASRGARRLLQPFVLRRTKSQVLDDLPPLTEIQRTVLMNPGEAKLYESVRKAALEKLTGGKSPQARVQVLAELTRLRRLCCHPELVAPGVGLTSSKLESLMELLEELVASKHRALVFSQFTDVLALVRKLCERTAISYQYLDGSTPMKKRTAAVDAFQEGEGDVFLISLKAGGFGLNLTGADYVIHVDPWWNPAVESQASDRAHRIGQTRPVTVYRLVTAGSIESAIVELHAKKRDLAESVLSGADQAAKLDADDLRALLL